MNTITGKTSLVGLLGEPVSHSLSPIMHNRAYKEMGLDWCYIAMPCERKNLERVTQSLRLINCKGLNITIPYKQEILKTCTKLTTISRNIQAVNTLIPEDNNQWIGANTDVEGFLTPLKNQNLINKSVIIIGCGGSARAVFMALNDLQLKNISIIGRNKNSLNLFIKDMKKLSTNNNTIVEGFIHPTVDITPLIEEASLIVNTTPLGMNMKNARENEIPLGSKIWNNLSNKTILYDLIYTPRPTNWLKIGQHKNCLTIDGLDMLVHQGALSIKLWSGFDNVPIKAMKLSAEKHLMV